MCCTTWKTDIPWWNDSLLQFNEKLLIVYIFLWYLHSENSYIPNDRNYELNWMLKSANDVYKNRAVLNEFPVSGTFPENFPVECPEINFLGLLPSLIVDRHESNHRCRRRRSWEKKAWYANESILLAENITTNGKTRIIFFSSTIHRFSLDAVHYSVIA